MRQTLSTKCAAVFLLVLAGHHWTITDTNAHLTFSPTNVWRVRPSEQIAAPRIPLPRTFRSYWGPQLGYPIGKRSEMAEETQPNRLVEENVGDNDAGVSDFELCEMLFKIAGENTDLSMELQLMQRYNISCEKFGIKFR